MIIAECSADGILSDTEINIIITLKKICDFVNTKMFIVISINFKNKLGYFLVCFDVISRILNCNILVLPVDISKKLSGDVYFNVIQCYFQIHLFNIDLNRYLSNSFKMVYIQKMTKDYKFEKWDCIYAGVGVYFNFWEEIK